MALVNFGRQAASTIANFIYGAVDALQRDRKILASMRSKGLITYGHGGTETRWQVKYQQGTLSPYDGSMTFVPVDRWTYATLGWGGYKATDAIQERERLQNKGKPALIKVYQDMGKRLKEDLEEQFPAQILISDGNAAGSELAISGIETFLSISGQEAGDGAPVGVNNDTYAGISTAGGALGGTWSEDATGDYIWPLGTGPTSFDAWRPLVVLFDSTKFSSASPSWKNNCEEALNFGITHAHRNGKSKNLDMVLLWRDGYRQFKDVMTAKQRINISTNMPMYELGFKDMFNYEGIEIGTDFDVPNNKGYGVPTSSMELQSLNDDVLFRVRDEFDLGSDSHRFACDMQGQLICESIRNFVQWRPITL